MENENNAGRLHLLEWISEAEDMGDVSGIHIMVIDKAGEPTGRVMFRRHGRTVDIESAASIPIDNFLDAQQTLLDLAKWEPGDSAYIDGTPIHVPLEDGRNVPLHLAAAPYRLSLDGPLLWTCSLHCPEHRPFTSS